MASVTVFVDDAVQGTLPGVCARDGISTSSSLRRHDDVGGREGLGIAWLLLLAGPLGWLGLLVIAVSKSGRAEMLSVELPMCDAAYERMRAARRLRDRSVLALLGSVVLGLLSLGIGDGGPLSSIGLVASGCLMVVSLVTLLTGAFRFDRESVGVTLDASRRWVTLSNVHPEFAAACDAQQAARRAQRA